MNTAHPKRSSFCSLGLSTWLAWWEQEAVRGRHWLMVLAVCGAERRESGCSCIDHEVVMRSKLDLHFVCLPVSHLTSTPLHPAITEHRKGRELVCGSYPTASCTENPNTFVFIKQIYVFGVIPRNHSRAIWGKHHRIFPEWRRDKDGYILLTSSLMSTVDKIRMEILLIMITSSSP